MKNLLLIITLIFCFNIEAQTKLENSNIFIRVYDLQGKKIGKGHISLISETSLELKKKENFIEIPISDIGSIKTKRSAGNNMLLSSVTGATTMAILGASTAEPDSFLGYTAGDGAYAFGLLGAAGGAVIGGISILFKKSKHYDISGDKIKWNAFKDAMLYN